MARQDRRGRSRGRAGAIVTIGAMVSSLVLILSAAAWAVGDSSVSITEQDERYQFTPGEITVGIGDTVTWTNDSDAPHTVTSDDGGGPLDSPELGEGDSYEETFDTAGDYAYHCEIHDYMQGVVHVTDLPPTDLVGGAAGDGGSSFSMGWLALLGVLAFLVSAVVMRNRSRDSASA